MRLPILAALLCVVPPAAVAMTISPKGLARFDYSYAKCEAAHPAMKGKRDEAWLSLWRIAVDDRQRAELAAVRKGEPYQKEARRAREDDARSPPNKDVFDQQCRALWGETARMRQGN